MYVCVCNAVTERDIAEAVRGGATTLRHLRRDLGVTAECGRCARCAHDCLRTAKVECARPAMAPARASVAPSLSLALEAS